MVSMVALAQTSFFQSVRPEATIVIKRHPMGSQMVEVSVLDAKYKIDDLRTHIEMLGTEIGTAPRGVAFTPEGSAILKSTFAIPGLISDTEPRFNLTAIAKAFAFGNKPLRQFTILFDGEVPNDKTPARWFAPKDAWMLEAVALKSPIAIEYRVKVNTKDPAEITLPGSKVAKENKAKAEKAKKPDYLLIGGIIIAAISVGLLVYSALIRGQRRTR